MNIPCAAERRCQILAKEGRQAQLQCYLNPKEQKSSTEKLYEMLALLSQLQGYSSSVVSFIGQTPYRKDYLVLKVEPSGIRKLAHSIMYRATVLDSGLLSRNFSIQIKPLLEDDAGTYETLVKNAACDDNHRAVYLVCFITLFTCQDSFLSVIANPHGPLVESEPLQLTCNSTHPGNPRKISWFHTGRLITTSGRFHSLDQSLFISRSARSDSGIWICELTYADGERISAMYNLEYIGEKFIEPSVPVIYTAIGSDVCLPCILNCDPADHGLSGVAARWTYKARREEKAAFALNNGNHKNCSLCLATVSTADADQYTCEITIRSTTISKTITLAVLTVIPSITGPVFEGSHLLLTCNLTYSTGDEQFQWKKLSLGHPNKTLSEAAVFKTSGVLTQGRSLEFLQVSLNDSGTWECSVRGPGGMVGSVQHHLEIAGTPNYTLVHLLLQLILLKVMFCPTFQSH
uniref:Lymphocyte activation gene 3 protein n=1 Tax=Salvator merianae TaxID=96440 RepID=A0A8D0E1D5_SALMN